MCSARVSSTSAISLAMRACVVSQLVGEQQIGLGQPGAACLPGKLERSFARRDECFGVARDLHALELAIMAHHILDRGRHHRLAAGKIFGGLGRRDELGRFVDRERHQRDVPAAR